MRILSVAAVLLSLIGTPASAQGLWENVPFGIYESDLQKVRPDAVVNPDPPMINTTARCIRHIPSFQLGGQAYEVCFYFLDFKLTQVMMAYNGIPAEGDYEDAVKTLTAKYGQAKSNKKTAIGRTAVWTASSNTKVTLNYMSKFGKKLNIVYQPQPAK